MSSSPPTELTHPLEQQVPGGWPEQPAEAQSETQLHPEPPSAFNFRTELKRGRGRGGHHRHRGRGRYQPRNPNYRLSRDELRDLAASTLETIDAGQYMPPHTEDPYDLVAKVTFTNDNTAYFAPDNPDIENWSNVDLGTSSNSEEKDNTKIVIREYSTLVGTRRLHSVVNIRADFENKTVGVLNFASAKKPGGGFLNGSQAQEESIARSSTLYPSLITPVGTQFYECYSNDPKNPFYTHAMIYSPSVVIFKNDKGHWMKPIEVDVLTSAAVNAGEVREQVHQAEEMRLLRERVRVAEEQRRRARERRRLREEELKRDEEDLRRSESAKPSVNENAEGSDQLSPQDKSEAVGEEPTDSAVNSNDNVEEKVVIAESKSQDTPTETPTTIEDKPEDSKEEGTVTSLEAVNENETEPSTTNQDAKAISHPLEYTQGTQETEPQSVPSESEPSEPAPDPHYVAEVQIDVQMYERIGRILYLFHKRGVKHLVLGSFGTGVFQNRTELVAGIFYDLLAKPNAKFKNVFDTIVFAILGGPTIKVFKDIFGDSVVDKIDGEDEVEEEGSEVEGMKDVESGVDVQVQGAGHRSAEHQMDGKPTEEPQSKDPQESTADIQDVEMSDLTRKPPDVTEPHLGGVDSQTIQEPPDGEPHPQLTVDEPQVHPVSNDVQGHPVIDQV